MKLAELLPLITEQTMIELSYLSGSDARVACCCDDVHSVIDCVREEGRDITELTVVSVDPDVYYFVDLSSFDTSRVKNMSYMFWGCTNLTTIKGVIDMKSCEYCIHMFENCPKLKGVKIKNPPANFEERSKLRPSQYTIVS